MFNFKIVLIVSLLILSLGLSLSFLSKGNAAENRWLEVVFEESRFDPFAASIQDHDYSEFWDERPNGIGMLKMNVKIIPNIDGSKDSFLIGYKAEIALNSQAEKLEKRERELDFCKIAKGPYVVGFFISLIDEDGFRLDLVYTESEETKLFYTSNFYRLTPGDKPQMEQAIIKSKELSPQFVERIKKVSVLPVLERCGQ